MSHVDEGILHAYLDGALDALSDAGELPDGATAADVRAHLDSCADCRARLETERAVRESAGLVMHDLPSPGSIVPELPALTTPSPRRKRWVPIGWAASIVLAVGAGWIGSEVWRTDVSSLPFERSETPSSPRGAVSGSVSPDIRASAAGMAATDAGEFEQAAAAEPERARDAATAAQPERARDAVNSSYAAGSSDATTSAGAESGSTATADSKARSAAPAAGVAAAASAAGDDVRADAAARAPLGEPAPTPGPPALAQAATALPPSPAPPVIAGADRFTGRSETPLGSSLISRDQEMGLTSISDTRTNLTDAQNGFASRMQEMTAFNTIIAREQAHRIHFVEASPADLISLADQIFLVEDASAPSIEAAREIGQTVVRVRQTTASGEQVELVTWRQHAVMLESLVVTGSPSEVRSLAQAGKEPRAAQAGNARSEARERGARTEAADAPPQQDTAGSVTVVMQPRIRTLADDRRELVLRTADASVWIAVRARLGEEELRALAQRLTIR